MYTGRIYNLNTQNMHINIGSLHPYYIYECTVAAYTIATGVFSSPVNVTTQETGKTQRKAIIFIVFLPNTFCAFSTYTVPTGAPLNLRGADVQARSVLLAWEPPQFDLQNGLIRQYLIGVTHNRTGLSYTVVSYSTQHLLQNLFPFNTYIFEVAAETVGLGPYSSQLTVTLLEDGRLLQLES